MAINPYTLNSLYQHGIIDYVDPALCEGQGIAAMNPMSNPYANINNNYMNNAMQGNLYQNYGMQGDSFTFSGNNIYNSGAIGSKSNSFSNMMFGEQGIGSKYQGDILGTGDPSIGGYYQGGFESAHGGFGDVKNNINSGMANASNIYNSTPGWVKGLLSIGIAILGIKMLFKGKGKKAAPKDGFFKKIINKIKGKQTPPPTPPAPKKTGFWNRLKFWK